LLLALASLLGLLACRGEGPLRFAVLFQDAQGIERGDEVEYKGLEIGEVRRVDIDQEGNVRVEVEVRPRHRTAVAMSSVIDIERGGMLGGRKLVIRDGEGARIPMLEGAELMGRESGRDRAVDSLRRAGRDALESVGAVGESLAERFREIRDSEKGQELADSLTRLGEETATMTREQAERFREEQLPALRARAEELRRELEDKGLDDEAKEVWDDFEQWVESVRSQAGDEG
jgi:phospholipid/cholesterol/gamma-HCH transport system substrate-binding protein